MAFLISSKIFSFCNFLLVLIMTDSVLTQITSGSGKIIIKSNNFNYTSDGGSGPVTLDFDTNGNFVETTGTGSNAVTETYGNYVSPLTNSYYYSSSITVSSGGISIFLIALIINSAVCLVNLIITIVKYRSPTCHPDLKCYYIILYFFFQTVQV